MKNILSAFALVLLTLCATGARAQYAHVVIGGEVRPGVYGRVEFGNAPPPPVVYAQPIVIVRDRRYVEPVYLHVPPGHSKKWRNHCHQYNACYRPVYFVKSVEYEPGYRPGRGHGKRWD